MVSFGKYNGHKYKSPGQTIGNGKCLVESKWMQIMQHTVKLNEESDVIINDWLFINYHDRINVLVQDPASTNDDPSFLVFKQSKYALEGRQSLAVVGGIIEPNENAKDAALREVSEEMGVICKTFQELGRFRTDVNRGMGWVNGFLARDCTRGKTEEAMDVVDEVGKPDTERQDLISIKLADLRRSAMAGDFLEVQWSNTVALALLHLVN
jgi:ADP-ribose pyrophosphatase YjhB (NUDIX family)